MKIICQNYSLETINQWIIAENVRPRMAKLIVELLNSNPENGIHKEYLIVADDFIPGTYSNWRLFITLLKLYIPWSFRKEKSA